MIFKTIVVIMMMLIVSSLGKVLDIFPIKPLYGHRRGKTVWLVFVKEEIEVE